MRESFPPALSPIDTNWPLSSARGLGREFLTAFALSGARGACVDLNLAEGEACIKDIQTEVSAHLQKTNPSESVPELRAYECNVTSEEQVKETFAKVVKDLGNVDVLVTAAGVVENIKAEEYDFARWKRIMDVSWLGTYVWSTPTVLTEVDQPQRHLSLHKGGWETHD